MLIVLLGRGLLAGLDGHLRQHDPGERCLPGVCGRQRAWAQPPRTTGLHRVAETQRPTKWIPVFYVSISGSCLSFTEVVAKLLDQMPQVL